MIHGRTSLRKLMHYGLNRKCLLHIIILLTELKILASHQNCNRVPVLQFSFTNGGIFIFVAINCKRAVQQDIQLRIFEMNYSIEISEAGNYRGPVELETRTSNKGQMINKLKKHYTRDFIHYCRKKLYYRSDYSN